MKKQKIAEEQRQEIVLVAVYLFSQLGRKEEVSRSELVDCLKEIQKEFSLGYEFPQKFPHVSIKLDSDLDDLWFKKGYLRHYRSGTPFPKNSVALWPLGRGHAKKVVETLDPKMIEALHKAIEKAGTH